MLDSDPKAQVSLGIDLTSPAPDPTQQENKNSNPREKGAIVLCRSSPELERWRATRPRQKSSSALMSRDAHPDLSEGPWQTRRTAISRTSTKNKSCRWVDQQVPSSSVGECVHGDTHDGQQNRGSSKQEIQNDTVTQTSHSSDIWAEEYALCNSLIDLLCPLQQNSH